MGAGGLELWKKRLSIPFPHPEFSIAAGQSIPGDCGITNGGPGALPPLRSEAR
jgi:hypothetical protein